MSDIPWSKLESYMNTPDRVVTRELFLRVMEAGRSGVERLTKELAESRSEVARLNGEVKRLTEWQAVLKTLHAAIDAAGLDVSPCLKCGCLVVCLPDGMPMCKACAEKQEGGR